MTSPQFSLLFLGKVDDAYCERALEFCRAHFAPVTYALGRWGDPFPEDARSWRGDYIISYLSRWVIREEVLQRAGRAAINFHPASPDYPGIGCTNFALYEGASHYGVTCHHMAPLLDSGQIVAVRRFPVLAEDNVETLLARTYETQIVLFEEIAGLMARGEQLPVVAESWTRRPFTRKEFNQLFKITPGMPAEEIERRVRAVSYREFQPYVELEGFKFEYVPPPKNP